jgi:hypothetical protein
LIKTFYRFVTANHSTAIGATKLAPIAIGYRRKRLSANSTSHYGVVVNPKEADEIVFTGDDSIVFLAE